MAKSRRKKQKVKRFTKLKKLLIEKKPVFARPRRLKATYTVKKPKIKKKGKL